MTEVELPIVAAQHIGIDEPSNGRYARSERVVGWRGHVGVRLAGRSEVRDGAEGHWSCGLEGDGERVEDVDRCPALENRLGRMKCQRPRREVAVGAPRCRTAWADTSNIEIASSPPKTRPVPSATHFDLTGRPPWSGPPRY